MQASALHWCREVAGQRKHRGLDGRTPAEVFDQAEAGTLTLEDVEHDRPPATAGLGSRAGTAGRRTDNA